MYFGARGLIVVRVIQLLDLRNREMSETEVRNMFYSWCCSELFLSGGRIVGAVEGWREGMNVLVPAAAFTDPTTVNSSASVESSSLHTEV